MPVHAELAAAVLLVIESEFPDELLTAFLKAAFAPVSVPPCHIRIKGGGISAGFVNLVQAFPSGGGKGGGDDMESVGMGIFGRTAQPLAEALQAAPSSFRLPFKTADSLTPSIMVIVGIHDFKSEGCRIACTLVFPDEIFLLRPDIRVTIEDRGTDAVLHEVFYNG